VPISRGDSQEKERTLTQNMMSTKQFKEDLRAINQLHTDHSEPKILSPNTMEKANSGVKQFNHATI